MTTSIAPETTDRIEALRAEGLTPKQIAGRLKINVTTVYNYVSQSRNGYEPPGVRTARTITGLGKGIDKLRGDLEEVRDDLVSRRAYVLTLGCLDTAAQALRSAKQAQELLGRGQRR